MRGSKKFSSGLAWGGGGVQARLTEKIDVVFFFVSFVSPELILQRESSDHGFFKDNYHQTITLRCSKDKDWGSNFSVGRGQIAYFYINLIEFVIFQGTGVRTPAPSAGFVRDIVNWVRQHIVLAKRHSMTLTPLMQVLCGLGKKRQGPTVK